jgi:ABC-type branched-subunit amino acid transport system substrate-binding protein
MNIPRRTFTLSMAAAALPAVRPALAQPAAIPGVTDKEIRIGSTGPLSGPAAAWSAVNKAMRAGFDSVNAAGGINGRQIRFILLDDGYSPPRTVEQTRKLVEVEQVAFVTAQIGSATGMAARKYMNEAKVPQLFMASGADAWLDDIDKFPWTLGSFPLYSDEGRAIGRHLLAAKPGARVGVLYQNDDAGRSFLRGLKEVLGNTKAIVREESYETTDPTVDSQVVSLQSAGADTLVMSANPKSAVQAIRKSQESWRPQLYMTQPTASISQVLTPAGLERSKGAICFNFVKDPSDPVWANDRGVQEFNATMDKHGQGLPRDTLTALGAYLGSCVVQLVRQCGNDLSRENLLRQTMALDLEVPMLLPGLRVKTGPQNRHPLRELRPMQFDGTRWALLDRR